VALNLLLLPRFGAPAAAWITVGTEWLVVVSLALVTSRNLGFTPSLRRTLACLTSLAGALIAGLVTVRYGPVPSGVAIVATFLLCVCLLRVLPLEELKGLLSRNSYLDV
jgi:hypothetical protein